MPSPTLVSDLAAIERIEAVPTILRVITETTGLRFTSVARVTGTEWHACAVHDAVDFGVAVGDSLDVATTLCSEVRSTRAPILIEHASQESAFGDHPAPRMYGFESYLSVPIFRRSGDYFGTLCGLDPRPLPLREGARFRDDDPVCPAHLSTARRRGEARQHRGRLGRGEGLGRAARAVHRGVRPRPA